MFSSHFSFLLLLSQREINLRERGSNSNWGFFNANKCSSSFEEGRLQRFTLHPNAIFTSLFSSFSDDNIFEKERIEDRRGEERTFPFSPSTPRGPSWKEEELFFSTQRKKKWRKLDGEKKMNAYFNRLIRLNSVRNGTLAVTRCVPSTRESSFCSQCKVGEKWGVGWFVLGVHSLTRSLSYRGFLSSHTITPLPPWVIRWENTSGRRRNGLLNGQHCQGFCTWRGAKKYYYSFSRSTSSEMTFSDTFFYKLNWEKGRKGCGNMGDVIFPLPLFGCNKVSNLAKENSKKKLWWRLINIHAKEKVSPFNFWG